MNKKLKGQGWTSAEVISGTREIHCETWNGFSSFVDQCLVDYDSYIFRGHARANWKLEPTIDRALADEAKIKPGGDIRVKHLEKFKHATRGRRGKNPKLDMCENDWWALGQHHGLLTPLLDWSESPFVSAYFAFLPELNEFDEPVVIYALSRTSCERKNAVILKNSKTDDEDKTDCIEFVRPFTDENPRLISQRGLFTRTPDFVTVDEWVRKNYDDSSANGACLLKIYIPSFDLLTALKSLNRMNVNHLSLFPDLDGASRHCNTSLMISRYG